MSNSRVSTGLEDINAFSMLYDKYAPALYGLILTLTPDPSTAEEVLEKSLLKIWKERGSYDHSKSTVFTWMLVTTVKHCTEILQQKKGSLTANQIDKLLI